MGVFFFGGGARLAYIVSMNTVSEQASKQTWELAVFPMFGHVYVAMSYIKMFSDSPGIQSYKECIQIFFVFFCCAQWAEISSSHGTADENGGHWQLELWVNGLVN